MSELNKYTTRTLETYSGGQKSCIGIRNAKLWDNKQQLWQNYQEINFDSLYNILNNYNEECAKC